MEKKYRIMAEGQRRGYAVQFDVLYYAKSTTRAEIEEEIGEAEGRFIREKMPPLNRFIPNEHDWHTSKENPAFKAMTLAKIFN